MADGAGSRVDGEDEGIGTSLLAAIDLLLGHSVVGGQVQLAMVSTGNIVRQSVETHLLEHNLALGLGSVDLLNGEVGIVGGLDSS